MRRLACSWIVLAVTAAGLEAAGIDAGKLVDLSHPYDQQTIFWPTGKPFVWTRTAWGRNEAGRWYAAAEFSTPEHSGTHLDAPIHFAEGKRSAEAIRLTELVAPAALVDVTFRTVSDPDYRVTRLDIEAWEGRFGRIPMGAIVLARTGWHRRWSNRKTYMGSDAAGDVDNLHFPGFSAEAATFLVQQREISGIGIDTASVDYGPSKDFIVHQIINGADKFALENLANLDRVPTSGATLIVAPMKIRGGSGAPARVYALLP